MATQVPNRMLAFDGGNFAFRNKLINGGMEIDQRNAGASVTSASTYTVDRWLGSGTGSSVTFQRVAATAKYVSYALRITGGSGNTNANIQQRIESSTARTLVGLPVVVSFYAASPNITTLRVALTRPNATDNWSAATNIQTKDITISPTMTRYETSFNALPSEAVNGLGVWFLIQSGLGAGQTLDITGVQLEEGSYATPFEQRPIGTELALCQRYYEKSYDLNVVPGTPGSGCSNQFISTIYTFSNNQIGFYHSIPFKVRKRTYPLLDIYSPSSIAGTKKNRVWLLQGTPVVSQFDVVPVEVAQDENGVVIFAGNYFLTQPYVGIYHYVADAEL